MIEGEIVNKSDLAKALTEAQDTGSHVSIEVRDCLVWDRDRIKYSFLKSCRVVRLTSGVTDYKGLDIEFEPIMALIGFVESNGWVFDWGAPVIRTTRFQTGFILSRKTN